MTATRVLSMRRGAAPRRRAACGVAKRSLTSFSTARPCLGACAAFGRTGQRLSATSCSPQTGSQGAAASRGFASSSSSRDPDAALKADFKRWLGKEALVLAAMVVVGVTGIQFYQNRESSPAKQTQRLVKQAEQCANDGDRKQAVRHCLHAYDIVKSTNPHDRHLFELAFAIAAQYETLGRGTPATTYYLDALEHLTYELDAAKRERERLVTLDRIAQCYENRGLHEAAERYFKQAISTYDQVRGRQELSKASASDVADLEALDREIPGVLFNYARMLMTRRRWTEAQPLLRRAQALARNAALDSEYTTLIDNALAELQAASKKEAVAKEERAEQDD